MLTAAVSKFPGPFVVWMERYFSEIQRKEIKMRFFEAEDFGEALTPELREQVGQQKPR